TMPPLSLENHAIPEHPHTDRRDAQTSAIYRHEAVDASLEIPVEELFDAAEISETLLPHGPHKCNSPRCPDVSLFQGADYAKKYRKTATIVADHRTFQYGASARSFHIHFLSKNGIEVRAEDQMRVRSQARTLGDYISGTVDSGLLEAELLERLPEGFSPSTLEERRRGDFTESD